MLSMHMKMYTRRITDEDTSNNDQLIQLTAIWGGPDIVWGGPDILFAAASVLTMRCGHRFNEH